MKKKNSRKEMFCKEKHFQGKEFKKKIFCKFFKKGFFFKKKKKAKKKFFSKKKSFVNIFKRAKFSKKIFCEEK